MPYKMNQKQFEAMVALSNRERYEHFISKVVDWRQLWGVKNHNGWLVPIAPEGFEYFPLWPHHEYAQQVTEQNFPGHNATEITLNELLNHWLPLFEEEKVQIAVFPTFDWTFWCIEPKDLAKDISYELKKYE